MKALNHAIAAMVLLAFSLAPGLVRAQDDNQQDQASFQTFYDQLGSQGSWIQTDDYGYVFQPNVQDPDWAPYTNGHWVDTEDGWAWVSDEPWGWATYHYGRWANIDGTGWVWVPGYRWAPAWVSWRYGGGYAGWAPLPPETFYGAEYGEPGGYVGVGFHFGGDVDVSFGIGAGCYNFVRVGDLCQQNYHGRYVPRNNNYTVINNTTNITNINVNGNNNNVNVGGQVGQGGRGHGGRFRGVAAGGPPINEVNAHSSRPMQVAQLTQTDKPGHNHLEGNSLSVYAPHVNPDTAQQARPGQVSQTINQPKFNRGDSITKPLVVNSRLQPAAPSADAIQAAEQAQKHAPAHAKIATEQTPVKTTFNKPLSALQPVTDIAKNNGSNPGNRGNNGQGHNMENPNANQNPAGATPAPGETAKSNASEVHQGNQLNPALNAQGENQARNNNKEAGQAAKQTTQAEAPQARQQEQPQNQKQQGQDQLTRKQQQLENQQAKAQKQGQTQEQNQQQQAQEQLLRKQQQLENQQANAQKQAQEKQNRQQEQNQQQQAQEQLLRKQQQLENQQANAQRQAQAQEQQARRQEQIQQQQQTQQQPTVIHQQQQSTHNNGGGQNGGGSAPHQQTQSAPINHPAPQQGGGGNGGGKGNGGGGGGNGNGNKDGNKNQR